MRPATAQDWEHDPFTAARQQLPFERRFSPAEMKRLQLGLVPEVMEDKWFIYWENNKLHFHRSWSGQAIYLVEFFSLELDGSSQVQACWVGDEDGSFTSEDIAEDQQILTYVINELLLDQSAELPVQSGISEEQAAIIRHALVGYGRSNQESNEDPS